MATLPSIGARSGGVSSAARIPAWPVVLGCKLKDGTVLYSPQTLKCLQVAAQTKEIHLVLGGKRPLLLQGQGPRCGQQWQAAQTRPPPWSQLAFQVTHTRLFLSTLSSPVLPLFILSTSFCFFLFHFSTIYLLVLVAPGISECHGSSQQWFTAVQCPFMLYDACAEVFLGTVFPQRPVQPQIGDHLSLTRCLVPHSGLMVV